ncbi:MAG: phosphoribosylamine--glycine ligase, partial [Cryobacterium sp.]|nr:phosphoribosylamine--glycine ligase [Cryobacterium sp.]
MRILLIGSGAREHAILNSLLSEDAEHEVIVAPGNPGMNAERVEINILNPLEVADLASKRNVDLVVIGPEAPLAAGAVDAVSQLGIPAFGPARAAAQLESSKAFAKQIMQQAGVPTGEAIRATTLDEVENALNSFGAPFVVKADGLNAGKGVLVTNDFQAALDHARLHLKDGAVLIEEFLDGKEVSLFIVTDGVEAVALAPAQDFKRVGDNDSGPNTGGMGAYSPLPWLEPNFTSQVLNDVAIPVIRTMSNVGIPFSGLLYCGLIITKTGVKVI